MATEIRRKDDKNRVLKKYESVRKNGGYEYKYPIGNGKRRSIYADTLEELRQLEKTIQKDVVDGIKLDNNMTVNDVYEKWCKVKRGLRDSTFHNYKYMYDMFVYQDFGRRKIADIRRSDVRAYYNHLNEDKGLALTTLDNIHTVLHQVLELAVEDNYIRANPADKALQELKRSSKKGRKCKEESARALTVPEMNLFEEFLRTDPRYETWQPIYTIMLWTGMRVGEFTGLQWDDVDFEKNLIHVQRTLVYFDQGGARRCSYAINETKTINGNRFIPMLPQVRESFFKLKELYELADIKSTMEVDGLSDFVFLNRFGKPYNQSSLNRGLGRIMRDCNFKQMDSGKPDPLMLPPLSNHWLRHTFVTRCVEAGLPVKAVQMVAGHADIETTMDIYANCTPDYVTKEMRALNKFFSEYSNVNSGSESYDKRTTVVRPLYDGLQGFFENM